MLRLFDAAALARALREQGHEVSERTVQRWKAQTVTPKAQDMAAIRRLLGQLDIPTIPHWAERMLAGIMALESSVSDDELAQAEARAAAWAAVAEQQRLQRRGAGGGRRRASA